MGNGSVIQSLLEQALLNTHTAFFAKVISVSGSTAKVQPLNMIKAVGGSPQKQAVLQSVPILQSVRKFTKSNVTVGTQKIEIYKPTPISAGDTVYCLCAERDSTETRRGNFSTPTYGHHSLSDAVIVGVV